jgi:GNAT superfamily N-acetyltransferase
MTANPTHNGLTTQITFQHYSDPVDYKPVSDFLIAHHQAGNLDGNWLEPAWEYMHYHPALDSSLLDKIGIWKDAGKIVAVAHYESSLGDAFFQIHPAYRHLRPAMLDYAEKNLSGISTETSSEYLCVYVNDNDQDFQALVSARGYVIDAHATRPLYRFDIPTSFPPILLPEGFRLKSLADECDWAKVHRVMWRGFNHAGEPPAGEEELESRRKMFDTLTGRRDLKIVVQAPNGDFASICGMFYEPVNQYAYVEPVATDPSYRRMGLGKAAVLEGIRRCGALGASVAYVGSDQAFYQAIGFQKVFNSECWRKQPIDSGKTS